MNRRYFCILCVLLASLAMRGQAVGDSVVASLLTCSPGTQVYSLYGHTGLRLRNLTRGQDVVFNYGVFDFRRPHFTWHFILGECDYEVVAFPYAVFMQEYRARGSSVVEQVLNLTPEEGNRLLSLLVINCLPENRTYRYDFLRNNCTTKARDMIEDAIAGRVVYEEAREHPTYRQLLHRYTADYPWSEAGNDLLLGAACDTVLTDRAAQFLPAQLMDYCAQAYIYDDQDNRRPLVATTAVLLDTNPGLAASLKGEACIHPWVVSLALLAVFLLVMLLEYAVRRMLWGVDVVLMTLQGVAGVLLCFMSLFSQHPTVSSNWQVWLLNPLPLLCLPWVVKCALHRRRCLYHYLNLLWLVLFVVAMPWIPQDYSMLTLPLALILLTRPISYYINYNRKKE